MKAPFKSAARLSVRVRAGARGSAPVCVPPPDTIAPVCVNNIPLLGFMFARVCVCVYPTVRTQTRAPNARVHLCPRTRESVSEHVERVSVCAPVSVRVYLCLRVCVCVCVCA